MGVIISPGVDALGSEVNSNCSAHLSISDEVTTMPSNKERKQKVL